MRAPLRAARNVIASGLLAAACSSSTDPAASADDGRATRARACDGPAIPLPSGLAAQLPPADMVTVDDRYAALARRVPGGFAGVLYEGGRPVLLLTDPSQTAAARAAIAPAIPGFDVAGADVRRVRWNFAQLYDWYRYLWQQPLWAVGSGVTMSDIEEQANRIYIGVADQAARDRLLSRLAALDLPCDLVLVGIEPPAVLR